MDMPHAHVHQAPPSQGEEQPCRRKIAPVTSLQQREKRACHNELNQKRPAEGTLESYLAHRDTKFGHKVLEGGLLAVVTAGATANEIQEWNAGVSEIFEHGVE